MSVQEANAPFISYMWHAMTLAQLGRVDEARTAVEKIMRIRPDFSLQVARALPSGKHSLKTIYLDSLREADVPE